jgi:F-type H+-transporting ATPase subunit O
MKQNDSVPDNKPPTSEDTIEGRYAAVLFTTASQEGALFTIYEDITYLKGLYDNSETFRMFTQNGGVGSKEIRLFNAAL